MLDGAAGGDTGAVIVPVDAIDWSTVAELQLWSLRDETLTPADAPAGTVGARYVVCAVFGDATWRWTDILDDPDEAVTAIRALSAVHGAAV
ncbi:MAG: hypothetical protein INR65_18085, partial [Gluconacetobacter diazotrophicus]|nr:hypothetical protein [Gluconacetobacter diazotrophicus]